MIEYLVGDGPNNRYALICHQCCSHNGMALKEEFEYTGTGWLTLYFIFCQAVLIMLLLFLLIYIGFPLRNVSDGSSLSLTVGPVVF